MATTLPAHFVDDDTGFLAWMADPANAAGYVVNSHRNPQPDHLVLHRATCYTIRRKQKHSRAWTVAYRKTCGRDRAALGRWARDVVRGDLWPCGCCKPWRPGQLELSLGPAAL